MGYTHYWTHRRRFTNTQWSGEVLPDLMGILSLAWSEGITIGSFGGESPIPSPRSAIMEDIFGFNGVGEDSHETFMIWQNRKPLESWQWPSQRGWDFCKTARKPYDVVVTACLCYLESCFAGNLTASSDGTTEDWHAGLALARRALPSRGNMLDIPFDVRWDSQFVFDREVYPINSEKYYCHRRKDGIIILGKNSDQYNPIAYVPVEDAEDFILAAKRRFSSVPTSCFGSEDCKRMARKKDEAIRDLITYPELTVIGAPTPLT